MTQLNILNSIQLNSNEFTQHMQTKLNKWIENVHTIVKHTSKENAKMTHDKQKGKLATN